MSSRLAGFCFLSSQQIPMLRHQDVNGEPLCWAESSSLPYSPAPQHGKEAKKLPFPACCLLPLSEIRIN